MKMLYVSSDWVILIAFVMTLAGFLIHEMWWVIGGSLLFFLGVITIGSNEPGGENDAREAQTDESRE